LDHYYVIFVGGVAPGAPILAGPFLFGSFSLIDIMFSSEVLRLRTYGVNPADKVLPSSYQFD
jgi:glutathione S-transferase